MAFEVTGLERIFKIDIEEHDTILSDPDPSRTPEQVMLFYANQYPILTNATVHGPEAEEDKMVYTFTTTLGTKG
jgi:PRTRC system protein C